ncbi:DUF1800 domain-containing protein [Jannaschia seohaensis]|uniref:Uncharacterized conserved protein, DUF1800 family n=1 Tax=Jannaschia seohaensis TaxID=475081 RepID=A0A2Y9AWG2_9RHOB|nr:DUF1800 domain-containing protein [Jannaschia seohaensis]PWJ17019.1 uncharacterized protein (DUF1800 family) [Jannaschia seohaensis]SSA48356.1 Uncharacterized conserved protein, DUF1800 family [Jannaschia seohaensis]
MSLPPTLAAIRFGTGLSPVHAPPAGPVDMMAALLGPDEAADAIPIEGWETQVARAVAWGALRRARRESDAARAAYRAHVAAMRDAHSGALARSLARAAVTRDGFRERLFWFWSDHFTVADGRGYRRHTISGYREDAIRPFVAGSFAALLDSAVTHPAMLDYLDQRWSMGPNSRRGKRGGGLNENLAREVLELHTLGAGGPYTQYDVTQLAELLTGLSFDREGAPRFRPALVEPGAETVLGRSYGGARPDPEAIRAVLADLAVHPATARHVSGKLARHFVAEHPDADLVAAMAARWIETGGDLPSVYAVMLDHPASAAPELRKVRRPLDYIAAAARALNLGDFLLGLSRGQVRGGIMVPMELMGQPWQEAPGPDGWPEAAEAWITPQGLAARIDWAMTVPRDLPELPDPRDFVEVALGPLASERTRFAARAAESRADGIGLILSAPEFQRR